VKTNPNQGGKQPTSQITDSQEPNHRNSGDTTLTLRAA